ncbi:MULTISPECIES: GspE/PulE family protein [Idiomarina]|uniref:Flp pilus assembly complex ATPase component TadA n=1 Tax=Idiomarina abyssalis TaxID=86102 RepID=A0A8I1KHK9_9GAMM|nr:GspE/PulE family protein [Idiomarina abyssalis]MAL84021.1 MSHA biogenesis protein MshE [Idiomarina sp.]MBJ7267434.1 Flp pilus assembly complex ATPase component TadA [Idiomarina abyssalis]MBJ7273116.1 Flp pilus assembly complex ATPase component TadA [Idiomarina abyssalis]MBJ7316097.1 Flp pilus assembly complex ATPase component TadA [Idiomarina abyssalis]MDA6066999.1 ATPase, T2SS/T4P/T4SS family [Idiomarina abyssalis]|tara:strand:- start:287 stop:2002 length:1716 start_codon:yes stop_codon:yes gene_type:complete
MKRPRLKMRLGDLLVHEQIITEDQLHKALEEQHLSGRKLGATLTDLGYISEQQLLEFLAQQLKLPLISISERKIPPEAFKLLPEVQARRHRALVIEANDKKALVGMSDPADLSSIDAINQLLAPRQVELAVVPEGELMQAFDNLYRRTKEIETFASQLQDEYEDTSEFELGQLSLDDDTDEATVAKLLQSIFEDAVQVRASDIHIEPDDRKLRIRQRVDGVLQENVLDETNIANALVLRLKLMAGLDISERRLPQDGRFNMKVRKHSIDVRVSTMPVQYGESCVLRLLDQSAGLLSLEQTGMPDSILKRVRNLIKRPHGMLLVTGPTGSGKTTTLYGALSELNTEGKKVITVEDPVEYRLPRISQVQVNSKIGLDFSRVLRTTLRQDPDIIMVGEMRDHETVEIGLRGSITGHLVLSTLHTNDAITSAMRLIDMGAPPYLVAAALRGILAQRLVRRVCDKCTEDYQPDEPESQWLEHLKEGSSQYSFKRGAGCQSCNHTGYRGRIGVFELLEMNTPMMDALRDGNTREFAAAAKAHPGYQSMATVALDYARQGVTSVDEVLFLAESVEDSI